MIFKFLAELFYERNSRHRRGIAQWTEGPTQHVLRQVLHVVDVFLQAAASVKTNEGFLQPVGTFATRDTSLAALRPVKLHGAQSELHDALLVVAYDNPARTEHRSSSHHGIELQADIHFIGTAAATRSATCS